MLNIQFMQEVSFLKERFGDFWKWGFVFLQRSKKNFEILKITQKHNLRILGFCQAVLSCVTPAKVEYLQLGTLAYLHRRMMLDLRMLLFSFEAFEGLEEVGEAVTDFFSSAIREIGSRDSKDLIVQTVATNMNVTFTLRWNFSFIEISRENLISF